MESKPADKISDMAKAIITILIVLVPLLTLVAYLMTNNINSLEKQIKQNRASFESQLSEVSNRISYFHNSLAKGITENRSIILTQITKNRTSLEQQINENLTLLGKKIERVQAYLGKSPDMTSTFTGGTMGGGGSERRKTIPRRR